MEQGEDHSIAQGFLSLHPRTPKLCANIHHPSEARKHRCHFKGGENQSRDDEVTRPCSYWNGSSSSVIQELWGPLTSDVGDKI